MQINKEKAFSLRGYVSCFDRISTVSRKYGYTFPSIKIIVSTSEALEDDVHAAVKRYMRCEIAPQYANEGMWYIGTGKSTDKKYG